MRYPIDTIEGVGLAFKEKLAKAGVTNTSHLLSKASTPKGRKELAATVLADGLILKWANMCDLMPIKERKTRKADNLHAKIVSVNAEKKLVRQTPTLKGDRYT
jgi:hypothetical protein